MKKFIILIFISLFAIEGYSQTKKISAKPVVAIFKPYRTIVVNLNNDNNLDTIYLSSSLKGTSSFNRISISLTGFGKKQFVAKDCWTNVDSSFLAANKNLVSSHSLFIKRTKNQIVILLFGKMDGAGYRDEFSIINIVKNRPDMVFDPWCQDTVDVEIPIKLVDLDHNGELDFIYTTYSEIDNAPNDFKGKGTFELYSPFWVYSIGHECKLNKPLTKKYNQEHYVFAGFKFNETTEVFVPANGGKKRACIRKPNGKIIWLKNE